MNDNYVWSKYELHLTSWKEYKEFLKDKTIYDEYDVIIPYYTFVDMIETYKAPGFVGKDGHININHIDYMISSSRYDPYTMEVYNNPEHHWKDDVGYAFSVTHFS